METDKMTAEEFGRWCYHVNGRTQAAEAIASRDAYRELRALEAAVDRAKDEVKRRCSETCTCYGGLRAAILGEPRFAKGQLMKRKSHVGYEYAPYSGGGDVGPYWEPVLDRNGAPVFLPVEE